MILACRTTQFGSLRVGNVFLSQRVCSPVDELAKLCFRSWDETYTRLRTQEDSTKVFSLEFLKDRKLMELNTATLAALRSLPKIERETSRLFTIACDFLGEKEVSKKCVWSNLPSWATVVVENRDGLLFQISNPPRTPLPAQSPWVRWEVLENDNFLRVRLLNSGNPVPTHGLQFEDRTLSVTRLGPTLLSHASDLFLELRLGEEHWGNVV